MGVDVEAGKLKAVAEMETKSKWDPGIKKVKADLKDSTVKTKEIKNEMGKFSGVLGTATKGIVGLGAALLFTLTAGVADSSTFRKEMAGVGKELKKTGEALGKEFKPEIEDVGRALKDMLKFVRENKEGVRSLAEAVASPFVLSFKIGKTARSIVDDVVDSIKNEIQLAREGQFMRGEETGTIDALSKRTGKTPQQIIDKTIRKDFKVDPDVIPKQAPGPTMINAQNITIVTTNLRGMGIDEGGTG